jgi:hypothetical protein
MEATTEIETIEIIQAPVTRGDCRNIPRPCPFIRCKWHVLWASKQGTALIGSAPEHIVVNWILDLDPEWSCVLDIADRGGVILDDIARVMGITKEYVRQIEGTGIHTKGSAFAKLRHPFYKRYLKDFL